MVLAVLLRLVLFSLEHLDGLPDAPLEDGPLVAEAGQTEDDTGHYQGVGQSED